MATTPADKLDETKEAPVYDFGIGHPSPALTLPPLLMLKCMQRHLEKANEAEYEESVGYGLCEGSWYFRSHLADWLNSLHSSSKSCDVLATNMVLTTGSSQSIELLLCTLKRWKRKQNAHCKNIVLVEDPSYFLMPNIVDSVPDCKLLPIPFVANGDAELTLDFAYLETVLMAHGAEHIVAMYIIPSHHNPLGVSYTRAQKMQLIRLCHQYKLHVIADETYNLLSFGDDEDTLNMIPFMTSIEEQMLISTQQQPDVKDERFCHSVSSLSKIIGPGFRTGWIYSGNQALLEQIAEHGSIQSGGCMAQFTPSLLLHLMQDSSDMTTHLLSVRKQLGRNCRALCDTLKQHDTDNLITFRRPSGGYFVWLEIARNKLQSISSTCNVKFFKGTELSSRFGPVSSRIQFLQHHHDTENDKKRRRYFETCVRFCFANLSEQQIVDGATEFVKCLSE